MTGNEHESEEYYFGDTPNYNANQPFDDILAETNEVKAFAKPTKPFLQFVEKSKVKTLCEITCSKCETDFSISFTRRPIKWLTCPVCKYKFVLTPTKVEQN